MSLVTDHIPAHLCCGSGSVSLTLCEKHIETIQLLPWSSLLKRNHNIIIELSHSLKFCCLRAATIDACCLLCAISLSVHQRQCFPHIFHIATFWTSKTQKSVPVNRRCRFLFSKYFLKKRKFSKWQKQYQKSFDLDRSIKTLNNGHSDSCHENWYQAQQSKGESGTDFRLTFLVCRPCVPQTFNVYAF